MQHVTARTVREITVAFDAHAGELGPALSGHWS
jgi:hypothetical protein